MILQFAILNGLLVYVYLRISEKLDTIITLLKLIESPEDEN